MINSSAADCPISVKFGTEFDYATTDVLQTFIIKCQGHSVKTSSDRQIIIPFEEIGVDGSNDNVKILIGSPKIAVRTHAQYKIGQNSLERVPRHWVAFKLQYIPKKVH